MYFIEDNGNELLITVEPDHTWVGEPWNSRQKGLVSQLDYDAAHKMSVSMDAWPKGRYTLFRIDGDERTVISELSDLTGMTVSPGKYAVVR